MLGFLRTINFMASHLAGGRRLAGSFAAGSAVASKPAARKLAANLGAAAFVALAILLPGSVAISDPDLIPAGHGISGPPKGDTVRLIDHTPLGKGDRLQAAAPADQNQAAAPNPDPKTDQKTDTAANKDCDPDGTIAYWFAHGAEPFCPDTAQNNDDSLEADRAYLIETASPGYTMTRQGPDVAIGRLNPEFARRLAAAIKEARQAGLSSAGIFSAYRPPAFGVGGFSNKFNSLHSYGLAVDMSGIGGPGSTDAKTWHEIAARHGVVCPYGSASRTEWNHCQPTAVKIIMAQNPLRDTITAEGPVNLDSMFEAGTALIEATRNEADPSAEEAHEGGEGKGFHLAGTSHVVHLGNANRGGHLKARFAGHAAAHQADAAAKVPAEHHRFKRQAQNEKA